MLLPCLKSEMTGWDLSPPRWRHQTLRKVQCWECGARGEHWPLLQARTSWLTSVGLSGDQWERQGTIAATAFFSPCVAGPCSSESMTWAKGCSFVFSLLLFPSYCQLVCFLKPGRFRPLPLLGQFISQKRGERLWCFR